MPQDERRRTPRYPFTAVAEIVDQQEDLRRPSQVRDLSSGGCYVETPIPFRRAETSPSRFTPTTNSSNPTPPWPSANPTRVWAYVSASCSRISPPSSTPGWQRRKTNTRTDLFTIDHQLHRSALQLPYCHQLLFLLRLVAASCDRNSRRKRL
jgi:hypothetical protein